MCKMFHRRFPWVDVDVFEIPAWFIEPRHRQKEANLPTMKIKF